MNKNFNITIKIITIYFTNSQYLDFTFGDRVSGLRITDVPIREQYLDLSSFG